MTVWWSALVIVNLFSANSSCIIIWQYCTELLYSIHCKGNFRPSHHILIPFNVSGYTVSPVIMSWHVMSLVQIVYVGYNIVTCVLYRTIQLTGFFFLTEKQKNSYGKEWKKEKKTVALVVLVVNSPICQAEYHRHLYQSGLLGTPEIHPKG